MLDVLIVCTANQCRSPMAAAVLQRRLDERGIEARVHSAGLLEGGRPATADAQAVVATAGLDISGHRSRQVTAGMVARADVVIAMARLHARLLAVEVLSARDRIFTLKELVTRAERAGGRPPGQPMAAWLACL